MPTDLESDLFNAFLDESSEALESCEADLVALESNPADDSRIQNLFRCLHSLKGNAALFGLEAAKGVAHDAESLLDRVRTHAVTPAAAIINLLLATIDRLRQIIGRARSGDWPDAEDPQVGELRASLLRAGSSFSGDPGPRLAALAERLASIDPAAAAEARSICAALGGETLDADASGPDRSLLELLADPIEEMLPDDDCLTVEALLGALRDGAVDPVAKALAAECWDGYTTFTETVGFDNLLREFLCERMVRVRNEGTWAWQNAPGSAPELDTTTLALVPDGAAPHREAGGKTMRVPEEQIDTFLAYVGELLVVGDMFAHIQRRMSDGIEPLQTAESMRRANDTFGQLSNALQASIMGIRLVTAETLLRKVPRLVRDVAQIERKQVDVQVSGDQIRIDKSLVDLLDAPLTHLVRNAVSHGIEAPGHRRAAGKPEVGRVRVSVEESQDHVVLRVEDDGAGLDLTAIQTVAERRSLVQPGASIGREQLIDVIFTAGVSTSSDVSEISGRGVGLDVVRGNIRSAGGEIDVDTRSGSGTAFIIRLPKAVTTQIIPGYMVRVADQVYILPMDRIGETARLNQERIHDVARRGRCIKRGDDLRPFYDLADLLGAPIGPGERVVVNLRTKSGPVALAVDEVLGVQKVVLRPIHGLPETNDLITGGALLGDGTVSLILDVDRITGGAPAVVAL